MTTAQQATDSAGQRELSTAELQQRAQQFVRDYITQHGTEPTGELVGTKHGMRERWGRNQISAVREERAGAAPARPTGKAPAQPTGTARGTVGEAVAARAATGSGTAGPASAVIGQGGSAPAAARPPAPPARPGVPSGTASGTGSDQAARPTGTAAARPSGTAARPSGTAAARLAAWMESGQLVAWAGFAFGAFVSVAANVMHAYIPRPPEGLDEAAAKSWTPPADWAPDPASVLGAAVWPIMLLLAVEVMSRVRWGSSWQWSLVRFGGVGIVGLGSAIISYGHIYDVLTAWHYGEAGAHIGPLVVDGLMVISGFALLSISQANQRGGRS